MCLSLFENSAFFFCIHKEKAPVRFLIFLKNSWRYRTKLKCVNIPLLHFYDKQKIH